MMGAVRISEKSVNFNVTTPGYISEDSKLQRQECFLVVLDLGHNHHNNIWQCITSEASHYEVSSIVLLYPSP
jgi:hypothetical protein